MRTPETYLRELLYTYDCLTIPGLGGFIMHYKPARIDEAKGRIYPPGRYPSFNSLLVHDDGLLISRIAQAENIPYDEASLRVSRFVSRCKDHLLRGNHFKLEEIGDLSLNPEGSIQFHPSPASNYYTGTFGMGSLSTIPRSDRPLHARHTARPADRRITKVTHKKPTSVKWTLALTIPVILFLLYGIIFPASVQTFQADISGLANKLSFTSQTHQPVFIPGENEIHPHETPDTTTLPADEINEKKTSMDNDPENYTSDELKPVLQEVCKFHVIGGCFENHVNAQRFLAELQSRGYNAREAGSNSKGHLRISFGSFADKPSALNYLEMIRDRENPDAWLLVY